MASQIVEVPPNSIEAVALIAELEVHLASRDYPKTSRHGYSVEKLLREAVAFFVTQRDGVAAACGGVQLCGAEYAEVKRMYVRPAFRGLGLGKSIGSACTTERNSAERGSRRRSVWGREPAPVDPVLDANQTRTDTGFLGFGR
jgi:GNAT superfamily N-acetyltransferase